MKKRRLAALFLALLMVFILSGCNETPVSSSEESEVESSVVDPEYPAVFGDTNITQKPARVVSLSPALTEICYDMGYEDALVGVSDYCDYPAQVSAQPKMGTAQIPNFEDLRAVRPEVVLSHTDFSEEDLIRFQQANIEVIVLPRAKTAEDLKTLYSDIGRLFAGELTGKEEGVAFYNTQMGKIESVRAKIDSAVQAGTAKKSAVLLRMLDFTVATGDTFEGEMLEKTGFENIAKPYGGWEFPLDLLAQYTPSVIFCDQSITIPMLEQHANYKGLHAVLYDLVYGYDFTHLERQGARMFAAFEDMAKKGYPDVFAEE